MRGASEGLLCAPSGVAGSIATASARAIEAYVWMTLSYRRIVPSHVRILTRHDRSDGDEAARRIADEERRRIFEIARDESHLTRPTRSQQRCAQDSRKGTRGERRRGKRAVVHLDEERRARSVGEIAVFVCEQRIEMPVRAREDGRRIVGIARRRLVRQCRVARAYARG